MSNTDSRFPTSKGQDTFKSTEDNNKKYSVSFSDNIVGNINNQHDNENTLSGRSAEYNQDSNDKSNGSKTSISKANLARDSKMSSKMMSANGARSIDTHMNLNAVNANQNLDNRYEEVVNEDDRAEGSKPADFFHTEYMRYRNLIHWKKVQNVVNTSELKSFKANNTMNQKDKLYQDFLLK